MVELKSRARLHAARLQRFVNGDDEVRNHAVFREVFRMTDNRTECRLEVFKRTHWAILSHREKNRNRVTPAFARDRYARLRTHFEGGL